MGLYLKQNDERTKLQQDVAAELRRKAAESALRDEEAADPPGSSMDGVESMSRNAVVGIVVVLVVLVVIVFLVLGGKNG